MAAAGEQLEPMNAMRRGIADHMRRSLDTSAHVTSAIEVDMSRVVAIRDKLKPEFQKQYGVNPTYLIFVARAVVETLKHYPWINGEIRGEQIVTRPWVNIGFAVELADGKGLIVPVVKHAEGLNLLGMAQAVTDIADRARNKKLTPGRGTGRDVHDHEPRRLRHLPRDAGDQPATGRDPRHVRARQAAVGRPGLLRQGRDRDPADHEHHAHVRPSPRRRRARGPLPQGSARSAGDLGRDLLLAPMDLVRLTVVPNEIEAEQIRSILGLEGIDSMQRVTNLGAGSLDGSSGMGGPREILVRPDDLETAQALIAEDE